MGNSPGDGLLDFMLRGEEVLDGPGLEVGLEVGVTVFAVTAAESLFCEWPVCESLVWEPPAIVTVFCRAAPEFVSPIDSAAPPSPTTSITVHNA